MISEYKIVRFSMRVVILFSFTAVGEAAETVPLVSLDITKMSAGWGEPQVNLNCVGKPMSIKGRKFQRGVGTHADSAFHITLDGNVERFRAYVGIDDSAGSRGTVRFKIYCDGKKLFDSGVMKGGDAPTPVDLDLRGRKRLVLFVGSAGDNKHFDHADWADAIFEIRGRAPSAVDAPVETRTILTPRRAPSRRSTVPGCAARVQGGRLSIAFPPSAGGP